MKRVFVLLFLFLLAFSSADDGLKEVGEKSLEKINDVSKNSNIYAEILGENLLKFQNFIMGGLGFLSLGAFEGGGDMAFIQFLFMILAFMIIYTTVGFFSDNYSFFIAIIITIIGFIGMSEEILQMIFCQYEAMGLIMTIILPVFILLAFTFRIYEKAYNAKSNISPFYAQMFNLIFLVMFGWFFTRHSRTEEGAIAIMRLVSGIVLMIIGVAQAILYKSVIKIYGSSIKNQIDEEEEKRKIDMEYNKKLRIVKSKFRN